MQHGHARHGPALQRLARHWTPLQWPVGQLRCAVDMGFYRCSDLTPKPLDWKLMGLLELEVSGVVAV